MKLYKLRHYGSRYNGLQLRRAKSRHLHRSRRFCVGSSEQVKHYIIIFHCRHAVVRKTTRICLRLLIALAYHTIEVRDLSDESNPAYAIPTVDQVVQLFYCGFGNYIATLETKHKRSGEDVIYLRVYCNWEQCSLGTPPLRARIAGRVTPTGSQIGDNALDIIEIPVKFTRINAFSCCQVIQYTSLFCIKKQIFKYFITF